MHEFKGATWKEKRFPVLIVVSNDIPCPASNKSTDHVDWMAFNHFSSFIQKTGLAHATQAAGAWAVPLGALAAWAAPLVALAAWVAEVTLAALADWAAPLAALAAEVAWAALAFSWIWMLVCTFQDLID